MPTKPAHRTGEQCVSVTLQELLLLAQQAKALSLDNFLVKNIQQGQHTSRLLGRGMEFAECRRYHEGDDIRSIDWKVTARTGKVHTKLFAEEKERQVFLCIDMRSSMFFASKGVFKSVQAALLSSLLAWCSVAAGHRLGCIIFDDEQQHEFRPAPGKRGLLPILQKLAEYGPKNINRKGPAADSLNQSLENMKRLLTPGSLLFLITDFRHFSPSSRDLLIQASAHCDLSLFFIYDPLEAALPVNGFYSITDGDNDRILNTFEKRKCAEYQKKFAERREQVRSLSQHRNIRFFDWSTETEYDKLLEGMR